MAKRREETLACTKGVRKEGVHKRRQGCYNMAVLHLNFWKIILLHKGTELAKF